MIDNLPSIWTKKVILQFRTMRAYNDEIGFNVASEL